MIYLKIIAIFITTGAGLLQIGLEHMWHDKRTKKHNFVRWLLILLMIVGGLSASILVVFDDQGSKKQIQALIELNNNAERAISDAEKREINAIKDREQIKVELEELQERLKPFEELARKAYPDTDIDKALSQLSENLGALESRTESIEQNISQRGINDKGRRILIAFLKDYRGRDIKINSIMGDSEGLVFAKQIEEIFLEAGWVVDGVSQSVFSNPVRGLYIAFKEEPAPETAQIIFEAFRKLNVSLPGFKNESKKMGDVEILVGTK